MNDKQNNNPLIRFTALFLKGYASIFLILIAFSLGFAALWITPKEEEPQIIVPFADIYVEAPGASAEEIENLVSNPLERLLWHIDGVEYVYSVSQNDRAIVSVRFYVGEDRERSLVKLYNKINSNIDLIPSIVKGWIIKPLEIDDVPIVNIALHSQSYDDYALHSIAEELCFHLNKIPNLSRSIIIGGRSKETTVDLNISALAAHHLSPIEIQNAILAANYSRSVGYYNQKNTQFSARSGSLINTDSDLHDLVVGVHDNKPVYLYQVAQISTGPIESNSYTRITFGLNSESKYPSSQPAVTIALAKKKGSNGIDVAKNIIEELGKLKHTVIPDQVDLTITRNTGKTAEDKVSSLLSSLFLAIAIVVALLFAFLGWRAGLIVAFSIPVTFSLALFTNYLFGFTINRVTLFALILTLGLVVDDPITVIDNIWRHSQLKKSKSSGVILGALYEVIIPVIMSTLAIIACFAPMLFITGMMGPYMRPMAFNVPLAVCFSTLTALTIIPWGAYILLKYTSNTTNKEPPVHPFIQKSYRTLLLPFLSSSRKRKFLFISVILGLVCSLLLIVSGQVPLKTLPYDNKDELQLLITLPDGSPLEKTNAIVSSFEHYLENNKYVANITSYIGTHSPIDFNGMIRHYYLRNLSNQADIRINLHPKDRRDLQSHAIGLSLRENLQDLAKQLDVKIALVEVSPGPPVLSTIVIELYSQPQISYEQIINSANSIAVYLSQVKGLTDIDVMTESPHLQSVFNINKTKAATNGVDTTSIVNTLAIALGDNKPSQIHSNRHRSIHPIKIGLKRSIRSNTTNIENIKVKGYNESLVSIGELGSFSESYVKPSIYHKNLNRTIYITAEVAGKSPSDIVLGHSSQIDNLLPPGITAKWAGEGEWFITLRVFRDLGLAFGTALIAIYGLLVLQTQSLIMPVIIMLAIPLTIIGVIPGFWILNSFSGQIVGGYHDPIFFTATAMIGMIALGGIVIRNSIVLIEFIESALDEGESLNDALVNSGAVRFRPILLTALTTALGVAPITFDPVFSGLAWSLIFGLVFSTCFTLILIPVTYKVFMEKDKDKINKT